MRLIVTITLCLYLLQLSSEKPAFLNWFGSTEPHQSSNNITMIIQDLTRRYEKQETIMTKISERLQNYDKFKKTRNRNRTTTSTKITTTATTPTTRIPKFITTKTPTTTTTVKPSNIIFESNEDIDFSVCHPETNPACVLDQVYSCTTSIECNESGKCERQTVCGMKFMSKIKE